MKKTFFAVILLGVAFFCLIPSFAVAQTERAKTDSTDLLYPIPNDADDEQSGLYLKTPANIERQVEFDYQSGMYIFTERVGGIEYGLPKAMTIEEYAKYTMQRSVENYWRTRTADVDEQLREGLIPSFDVASESFAKVFGGNTISVVPQGFVEVSLGYQINKTENPAVSERLRKVGTFDFDQQIQLGLTGTIGEKMNLQVNYNTESTFNFENQLNLEYAGDADEIIQKIEAGNVSLPLNGSLITGANNLFGIRADLQFGKLSVSTILSQSEGDKQTINVENGVQKTSFEISASDYDANKHFFLSQFFHDTYDQSLQNLPVIRSGISVNRVELWVTNRSGDYTNARDVLAMLDLGEHDVFNTVPQFQETPGLSFPNSTVPYNEANQMYDELNTSYAGIRSASDISSTLAPLATYGYTGGQDYEKVEQARKLDPSEYTINEELGYISLNIALNTDEVLAVAYNYTYNGQVFQVGEFSDEGIEAPNTLLLKLLKGTELSPQLPTWDLMMKNVYNLGAYSITAEDFELNVMYQNEQTATLVNYLPGSNLEGHILLNVMNLDNLNNNLDQGSNGVFDYIEGLTVHSSSGCIIFPVVEPFGSHLEDSITSAADKEKYAYTTLYDSTQVYAQQDAEHNRFYLSGSYSGSSSSDISVGAVNLDPGSVVVTSGGVALTEGVDYVVDYTLGRVQIINPTYQESGASLQITTESQDLFSVQQTTLMGAHANYAFSDNLNLGGTLLYMNDKPVTQKVDYGDDPISNMMLGLDLRYGDNSQLLTDLINKIPLIETDGMSSVAIDAEYAKLITFDNNATDGVVYIDDFENTQTSIDLSQQADWSLASIPQSQSDFPEASFADSIASGFNRAKLAWYTIDPLFTRSTSLTPDYLVSDLDQRSDNLVREVYQQEIYPDIDLEVGSSTVLPILNVAYYPEERGQYNFDSYPTTMSAGISADGTLNAPETRWGGMMRSVETTNFQTANVEYIEFWLMDPFVNDTMSTMSGADLYFNLGDISEDVLRDSKKLYENGLPEDADIIDVDTTTWGRVPTKTQITNAFVNSDVAIANQDVGFDGLNNEAEQSFYSSYLNDLQTLVDPTVYNNTLDDPAADNYQYFRGSDLDANEVPILERYKDFNGVEGNSLPASLSPETYSTAATTLPDGEDVNNDNTLNEYERYYQYHVSLRRSDMVVGQNNITAARTVNVEVPNGETTVTWYRFRIPVYEPDAVYGNIADFTSIRFMRMFLKNSEDPIHLRFASLDLVRSEWRKYSEDLETTTGIEGEDTNFEIASVNIEEDANRSPVNYVLPPEVEREIDPSNSQLLALNEQAMSMEVSDLEQGDSRAAFKVINMDFRLYENIKLDVHAEAITGEPLNSGDLYFFVRMGSDYNYNYYEYELPLSLTDPGMYSSDVEADRLAVWPDANRLDFPLSVFTDTKLKRNEEMRAAGSSLSLTDEFSNVHSDYNDNQNLVKIKGNPSLSSVQVMMFGIRHKDGTVIEAPKSVEVWVNELRLTEAESEGGWAANARVAMDFADFGNLIVSGNHRSAGFGSIDQSVSERPMDDFSSYDITSNLQLGKFFSEKARVQIPLYFSVSKSVSNPLYDPLNDDLTMEESLAAASTKAERDSIKKSAQSYSKRSSVILNNVKVDRVNKSGKPRIYDPTNFSVSFSHNKGKSRDEDTEYDIDRTTRFAFNYNFNNQPKVYEPFKKIVKSPVLALVRDFNFSLMPTTLGFRSEIYRYYNEVQTRNISNPDLSIPVTVEKDFLWSNSFNFTYNLAKSLEVNFTSEGINRIDEPAGRLNKADDDYDMRKDSIMENFWNMGRPILYQHSLNVNYQIPINKIAYLDWMAASARYQGIYNWEAGPITDETFELGNTVDNSRITQLSGQASFLNLYNKIPYLKGVNQRFSGRSRGSNSRQTRGRTESTGQDDAQQQRGRQQQITKTVSYNKSNVALAANQPTKIKHNLRTSSLRVRAYDENGTQVRGSVGIIDDNTISYTVQEDLPNARIEITGRQLVQQTPAKNVADHLTRLLMMVRTGSVSYSGSDGTILPGFLPEPSFLGGGNYTSTEVGFTDIASSMAPGLPFLLGWQDEDFAKEAAAKGWITQDSTLNSPYIMTSRKTWDFRLNLEPINSLKIDLTANRSMSENMSEYYLFDQSSNTFIASNKNITGSFTMSINTWATAFSDMGEADVQTSEAYNDMMSNRLVIAQRLASKRVENTSVGYDPTDVDPETGFPLGYGPTSQEVLLPAFIAAYTGQSPNKVSLNPFPSLKYMSPNWRLNYNGDVSKINGLNRVAKSVAISHAYQSSYNVGQYQTNFNYDDGYYGDGYSYVLDANDNFVAPQSISSATILELFNPLVNVDVTWINDLSTSIEFNRARNMTMSFANNQMTEVISREYAVGLGYRFPRMDIFFKNRRGQQKLSNDLNLRADVGVRRDKTLLRQLVDAEDQLTAGQKAVTIKVSADYQLTDRFQLRLYYDEVINNPYTSNAFPTSTTSFGMSFRLILMQ